MEKGGREKGEKVAATARRSRNEATTKTKTLSHPLATSVDLPQTTHRNTSPRPLLLLPLPLPGRRRRLDGHLWPQRLRRRPGPRDGKDHRRRRRRRPEHHGPPPERLLGLLLPPPRPAAGPLRGHLGQRPRVLRGRGKIDHRRIRRGAGRGWQAVRRRHLGRRLRLCRRRRRLRLVVRRLRRRQGRGRRADLQGLSRRGADLLLEQPRDARRPRAVPGAVVPLGLREGLRRRQGPRPGRPDAGVDLVLGEAREARQVLVRGPGAVQAGGGPGGGGVKKSTRKGRGKR